MTLHSRTSTTMVTAHHHGSSKMIARPTKAMPVIALSAIGSAILPKSVTRPRLRAMSPSILSVIMATTKIAKATSRHAIESPPSTSSATPKNGTSRIRNEVRDVRQVEVARLLGRRGVHSGAATEVDAPGLDHPGAHHVAHRRRPDQRRGAVHVRSLVGGPADDVPVGQVLDQYDDLVADALLGALRGQLLDQVDDVRGAGAHLVLAQLVVVGRGLGAVLVGVAEHPDHVEPGLDQEVAQGLEVALGLAREADDDVGADARLGCQ